MKDKWTCMNFEGEAEWTSSNGWIFSGESVKYEPQVVSLIAPEDSADVVKKGNFWQTTYFGNVITWGFFDWVLTPEEMLVVEKFMGEL